MSGQIPILLARLPREAADGCDFIQSLFPTLSSEQIIANCVRAMAHSVAIPTDANHQRALDFFCMLEDEVKREREFAMQAQRIALIG